MVIFPVISYIEYPIFHVLHLITTCLMFAPFILHLYIKKMLFAVLFLPTRWARSCIDRLHCVPHLVNICLSLYRENYKGFAGLQLPVEYW